MGYDEKDYENAASVPATEADTRRANPFALYAELYGGEAFFEGDYIKLTQDNGWVRGQNKEPINTTEMFVANLQEARHGWIKFDGDKTERKTVLIMDNPQGIPREECGDMETRRWKDNRDPWMPVIYLPMRCLSDDSVVCFTGTGMGASRAVGELCRIYGRPGADRGGKMPVVLLDSFTFENRQGGTTRWPRFKIVDWQFFEPDTPAPPVELVEVSVVAPPAAKTKALAAPKRQDMDDEIPF